MDLREIYLGNFIDRDGKAQSVTIMTKWGFQGITFQYERIFDLYGKLETIPTTFMIIKKIYSFYGRATDDTSMKIGHGRMTIFRWEI